MIGRPGGGSGPSSWPSPCLLLALGVGIGACTGGNSKKERSATGGTTTSTGAPAVGPGGPGGTIRLGVPEQPASLDPFDPKSRTAAGDGGARPGPAPAVPGRPRRTGRRLAGRRRLGAVAAPDVSSATFSLRSGARWSDGHADHRRRPAFHTGHDPQRRLARPPGRLRPPERRGRRGPGGHLPLRRPVPRLAPAVLRRRLRAARPPAGRQGPPDRMEGRPRPRRRALPARTGHPGLSVVLDRNDCLVGRPKAKAAAISVLVVPDVRTMEQLLARQELDVAWPPVTANRIGRFRALAGRRGVGGRAGRRPRGAGGQHAEPAARPPPGLPGAGQPRPVRRRPPGRRGRPGRVARRPARRTDADLARRRRRTRRRAPQGIAGRPRS